MKRTLLAFVLACAGIAAEAVPVTFYFSGKVLGSPAALSPTLVVGQAYVASFSFDTIAVDEDPDPTQGQYSTGTFGINFGSAALMSVVDSAVIGVTHHPIVEGFGFCADMTGSSIGAYSAASSCFSLADFTSTSSLLSDALPTALDLAEFAGHNMNLTMLGLGHSGQINMSIDAFGLTPLALDVPEPAIAALAGLALAGLAWIRRNKAS